MHTRMRVGLLLLWVFLIVSLWHSLAIVPVAVGNMSPVGGLPAQTSFQDFLDAHGVRGVAFEICSAVGEPFVTVMYDIDSWRVVLLR